MELNVLLSIWSSGSTQQSQHSQKAIRLLLLSTMDSSLCLKTETEHSTIFHKNPRLECFLQQTELKERTSFFQRRHRGEEQQDKPKSQFENNLECQKQEKEGRETRRKRKCKSNKGEKEQGRGEENEEGKEETIRANRG